MCVVRSLRDFGSPGIICMNFCVSVTVVMVMLLRDFEPYWTIFDFVFCVRFPVIFDGKFSNVI
jgi:hypothetical protein